jgi:DNA polymerase I-like protein with 3'-5' exonuclease and polymerase domains
MTDIGARMLMQVHDSIIFEVPDNQLNTALPTIKLIMEDFDFDPKPGVDVEYGRSWGTFQPWDGISMVSVPSPLASLDPEQLSLY